MASRTTFTGIVRSNGGDSARETYAGSVGLQANFILIQQQLKELTFKYLQQIQEKSFFQQMQ